MMYNSYHIHRCHCYLFSVCFLPQSVHPYTIIILSLINYFCHHTIYINNCIRITQTRNKNSNIVTTYKCVCVRAVYIVCAASLYKFG